ncbi:MAG: NAD(P)/FAD-dependent oxidoreductase [Mogibacterium sp.]|nr:NAD(P)/FAD-dependent oxidoreductase [Mogibacterium sp.]
MKKTIYDIVVIGGGASGLMLAANMDLEGAEGLILEGSARAGSKRLMSGGGRCNMTHGGPARELIYAYGDAGTALRRCLYKHNNLELALWMDNHGVTPADENGEPLDLSEGMRALEGTGRIFPASMKSRDVLDALLSASEDNGWQIGTNAKVSELRRGSGPDDGEANTDRDGDGQSGSWEIGLQDGSCITSRNVVIASGGVTYPETGSDGSMFGLLKELGVKIAEPRPALAPVFVEDYPYADLSGISVPDVTVIAFGADAACTCKGKAAKMKGDLLFTHEGFSGPVILNISKYAEEGETLRLCYNKELPELPKRMQKALRDRARGPLGDVRTGLLARLLNQDDFTVRGTDSRGMVTAGGVALDEVDMKTMRVKAFDGLYVIGEALDADGITGGYNLQMCWSTACTCADDLKNSIRQEH